MVDEERSQLRNRSIARERLAARLANALTPTRHRRADPTDQGLPDPAAPGQAPARRDQAGPTAPDPTDDVTRGVP